MHQVSGGRVRCIEMCLTKRPYGTGPLNTLAMAYEERASTS